MTAGRALTAAFALMALCGVSAAAQLDRTTVPTRPHPREALDAPPTTSILPSIDLDEGAVAVAVRRPPSSFSGLSRQVVNQQLKSWSRSGYLETGRGTVRLLDVAALERMVTPTRADLAGPS